jgi:hypothetical protein
MLKKKFLFICLIILLLNIIIKLYSKDIIFFSISNFFIFLSIILLLYLIIKLLKYFYFQNFERIKRSLFIKKRVSFFEKNVYDKNSILNKNSKVQQLKKKFLYKFTNERKVAILNKNFFFKKRKNLLNDFIFLKVLSKNSEDGLLFNTNEKKFSILNIVSKIDLNNINFDQPILDFFNNDSYLIKRRRRNYYSLLLIHFLILKLQRKELINSLNLDKKIGNYPFTLAYDEEIINFRRSKYFDYTSTELFFLLLYGLIEWFLVFYLIHLGLCIFYDINVFELFFKTFENFLPNHFHAYSDYLRLSILLNSIFFFFFLIYTLTDWVFELTDEVSTYQLPPKDWFVDVFLPSLQGVLLFIIFSLIFFLFFYNGYIFFLIIFYIPFEYFYNFTLGYFINIENLVVLITLFDVDVFLKLFFLNQPGVISNFYSPFFHKTNIFYRSLYNENFLWNYTNVLVFNNQKEIKSQFYFFSVEYENFLQLKIWKNELLSDVRKYNYFLKQEDEILLVKNYINKGFRGLGIRLDNQYFLRNIDFVNKNNIRHFRPNNESLIDPILSSKYQQYSKKNDIEFLNLSIFPNEKKLIPSFFDYYKNDNSNIISNQNNFEQSNNNFFVRFLNNIFFNNNLISNNFFSINNFTFFSLDLNDFIHYKINSKYLYNDLVFENLNYFSDNDLLANNNSQEFKKLNNFLRNAVFLPYVLPQDENDLLLLNLKIFNLDFDSCKTLNDLKDYIGRTLVIGDFLSNQQISEKYLTKKQKDALSSNVKYSIKFYNFLKQLMVDDKNITSLILLNLEFLINKQKLYDTNIYKDEIDFLIQQLKNLEFNQQNFDNLNLIFSKITIKNDFIFPFLNVLFKPFYFVRSVDSLSFMSRLSSTNNSLYYYENEEDLGYWWDNYLILNNKLLKLYANFPSIFSFSNRKNIIYLKNFGEKIKFKNYSSDILNDNINEITYKDFSSYYNMEIKIQNFSYFQNTLWDRYFHKFYDSTFITEKREVFLVEYVDNLKNKLCFVPKFEQNFKRFVQIIFPLNWKQNKDFWLEYPQQSYVSPFVQYSNHLLDFPDYYKLELDFSQAILDYESFNLFEGYRNPIFFSEDQNNSGFNVIDDLKNISVGFIIDRDLLRTYQNADFVGLLLLKDYQANLLFDKKNFLLNNFLYNLFLDKLNFIVYDLKHLKSSTNFFSFSKKINFYGFNKFFTFQNFFLNFKNFYNDNIQFTFYNDETFNLSYKSLFFSEFINNDFKEDRSKKKFVRIFMPSLNIHNIYILKNMFTYFNLELKQQELNGIFERINIKLSDFINRFFLKKKDITSFDFLNNSLFFFGLRNFLKLRSVDPWELYLINKNSNIYDSLICNEEFLFTELPYDELIENSRNKLLNLQKLTYRLTPYRLNYRDLKGLGLLRKDVSNFDFKSIIAFYLDRKNFYDFKLKIINKKLKENLITDLLENYKNKIQRDLTDELSYEIGISEPIGRKFRFLSMNYRILHFTNSHHFLLTSRLFCNIFYNNKINPYFFGMYNFPFNNEFSAIWSKSLHSIFLSTQILEKIKSDRIFGREIINNQIRYKRIFFLKFFKILNAIENAQDYEYYKNFQKNFSLVFNIQSSSFFFEKNKIIGLKNSYNYFFDNLFWSYNDVKYENFKELDNNNKYFFNEFDYLMIFKNFIPSLLNRFYDDIGTPSYAWFIDDNWVSKRFRKYGFRLFKTYRTFYFKDERFPINDYITRNKIKKLQDFEKLEKPQLKRKKFIKKQFIYHDQKLLIYKFMPAVRTKVPISTELNYRWVFIVNKIKPTPIVLIFKNNEIRISKLKTYLFFLETLGNSINEKAGSLFWKYFLNNNNYNIIIRRNLNYNFDFNKSFFYYDIGKLLYFYKESSNNLVFDNIFFRFYMHLFSFNIFNIYYFNENYLNHFDKKFKNYEYNIYLLDNFREKKLNQFKYLTRFLIFNKKDYNYLNFYSPEEYSKYNKFKWNCWLNFNKYRSIEEHYIQYNLTKDKSFYSHINEGNDFNIKEIEEMERMQEPYFLGNPAALTMQLQEYDDLPFNLSNPKKYYIPYIHEYWYYNNLHVTYPINNKILKFYSYYSDFYDKIRIQTLIVLKKKIQYDFFQIQKIYYVNNLLYKYNYEKNKNDFYNHSFKKTFFFSNNNYYLKIFLNFIKYQFIYFITLLNFKNIFYLLLLFLEEVPLIGKILSIVFNFFFSIYLFIFNLFSSYLFPFFLNFINIIFDGFLKFFQILIKIYFHPFWILILYFFWVLYYYTMIRVFTNSKEHYNFKNLFAQFDWDEKVYDFDLVRRKFDTESFFEIMKPTHNLFLKNVIEFQERDRSPTVEEIEKLNTFSYEQQIFKKNLFFNQFIKNHWFVKKFPDYESTKTDFFESNLNRQSNAFIYNYFIKPLPKLFLNTNYVSKTNFIFNNNNVEKLILKSYSDNLFKDFKRHGSDTSEFGRFRWLYIASMSFFQFLLLIFITAFIIFLLF